MFTAISFAPVQGFIERSRKLRDLYGGSFILSYLAKSICEKAKERGCEVVSPALLNVVQGTPNQIILRGNYPRQLAKEEFINTWKTICRVCREWIEARLPQYTYSWKRDWDLWGNYAWEFFWGQGDTISQARQNLTDNKRKRDWVGINWKGESSTLSGADAIAWYGMGSVSPTSRLGEINDKVVVFYKRLAETALGESFIEPEGREQLSIPELIKRMVTYYPIANKLGIDRLDIPSSFADLSRWEENVWTGWFQGDGDRIGEFLQKGIPKDREAEGLHEFSQALMDWGDKVLRPSLAEDQGRIIYAGGDDFLGVIFPEKTNKKESKSTDIGKVALTWFYEFPNLWRKHGKDITVSVGLVVAAGGVPQRDIIQHCRETEKYAKDKGKDRLGIRVLFNGGNYLQWHCPWNLLQSTLTSYRDRQGGKNWNHVYEDIATLESRHAFQRGGEQISKALLSVYFPNTDILSRVEKQIKPADLTDWTINLAKVGWHLCSDT
ncbi:MAG: type III-B CRISPR-associated protein Cas10/Cmr2 [Pseudanabaenaceae cyanobacterium SKYGB_i_bin29]|nr:CRISPR-associated protein Cmr2 [Pseudanabaenaceae cyanobacterium SKYG29]MDW8420440.1 type III-B CRISPR-associated protein Cas10/Cmr2 [Pseudanabaenaceae cyanobacterium SKYGB_i_bin29]